MRYLEILNRLQKVAQADSGAGDIQSYLSDLLVGAHPVESATILECVKDLRSEWEQGIKNGLCSTCGADVNERIQPFLNRSIRIYSPCPCLNKSIVQRVEERLRHIIAYRVERNRAKAGLSPMFAKANLKAFEPRPGTEEMLQAAHEFDMTNGLFLMGEYGCGKSHIAAAICNRMLSQEYSCKYAFVPEVLADIRATYSGNGSEYQILSELTSADLLVLDDIGAEKSTEFAMDRLFTVVDSRYRNLKPTIYTTNLNLDQLETKIGCRIVDRILGSCRLVICEAPSYRQEVQQTTIKNRVRGKERDRRFASK